MCVYMCVYMRVYTVHMYTYIYICQLNAGRSVEKPFQGSKVPSESGGLWVQHSSIKSTARKLFGWSSFATGYILRDDTTDV